MKLDRHLSVLFILRPGTVSYAGLEMSSTVLAFRGKRFENSEFVEEPSVSKITRNSEIFCRRAVLCFRFIPRDCVITQAV